ncbi:MAG: formate/nitrite transporter family protein [Gemella sp.]|nr:formate/nitrite transporter family protein [Gemella sp.]
MLSFREKIEGAVSKKEALFDESIGRSGLRSLLAGAYLTMTAAAGLVGADLIAGQFPVLPRFVLATILSVAIIYILFLNVELSTSNMMFLTVGAFYKKISFAKATKILLYCTVMNFVGAAFLAFLFSSSFSFLGVKDTGFLATAVKIKLAKSDWTNFTEGIIANMFVNLAVFGFLFAKDEITKAIISYTAVFMFVFLINEHVIANFSIFMLAAFSPLENIPGFTPLNVLRQWGVVFLGNWVGAALIGLAYAYLNETKTNYKD